MSEHIGQLALDLGYALSIADFIDARNVSWIHEVIRGDDDIVRLYHELSEAFGVVEALDRVKGADLVTRRGVPLDVFVECTGVFTARSHHQVWDRCWAYRMGWPMRALPFIDGWDYRNRRPVFVKLIER